MALAPTMQKHAPFFFSSRRRHTRYWRDWSSDVCSSDLKKLAETLPKPQATPSVNCPELLTLNASVLSEAHVTWLVISLVSGGCIYVPYAVSGIAVCWTPG